MSTISILIHSLGWALVHSIWQGALVFMLLRAVLYLSPGMSARIKYHSSLISLMAVCTWFAITCIHEWQRMQTVLVRVTEGSPVGNKEYFITVLPSQGETNAVNSFLIHMEKSFPWLIGLYVTGVIVLSLRFLVNVLQVQSWKKRGITEPGPLLVNMLENLTARLDITKRVRLFITEKVQVPVMIGALKPVILLPMSAIAGLNTEQLEAILIHELAHIKRNDYLLNIMQTIIETILFFNPFTWMISSIIRREREHCCDDIVLSHTMRPLSYAKALAELDAFRLQQGTLALAASGNKNHLLNRIKRIMETKKRSLRSSHVMTACVLIATLILSVIWLTPSIAQDKKQSKKEQPKTEKISIRADDEGVTIDSNGVVKTYRNMDEVPDHVRKQIEETVVPAAMEAAASAIDVADEVIREVDVASIVSEAMAAVDWNEISDEVNKAMKEVDWDKINRDVNKAMKEAGKELNDPKIRKEISKQITVAQADARKAMAEAREEAAKARKEVIEERRSMRKDELEKQKVIREQQREEMIEKREAMAEERERNAADLRKRRDGLYADRDANRERTDAMLDQMEKDGLISKRTGYTIMRSGNTLIINGKQQDAQVLKRYDSYLDGENVIIKGNEKERSVIKD